MKALSPAWLKNTPIAHRGLHAAGNLIPENSIKAFENAIQHGYAIELDVHVIADEEVIVFHDDDLKRMCHSDEKVHTLSSANLKYYKLLPSQEPIPLLKEVLRLVNGRVPILIEIKRQPSQSTANMIILNALLGYKGEFAIQSFDPFVLGWFAKNAPFIVRGQLSGNFKEVKMGRITKYLLKKMMLNFISKPHFVAYDVRDLPNARIERFRRKQVPVLGWTVTGSTDHNRVRKHCDNIIFESFQP